LSRLGGFPGMDKVEIACAWVDNCDKSSATKDNM